MSTRKTSLPGWLVPVIVIIIAAVLVFIVLSSSGNDDSEGQAVNTPPPGQSAPSEVQGPTQPDYSVAERLDEADPLTLGPVDAPVVMVAFSDYQCPYCARWSEQTLPAMAEYAESGDLRIEWRDLSIFGEDSSRAALAAYAAAEQDAFWDYHDMLFPGGETTSAQGLSEESLIGLADELGLDTVQFEADMKSPETAQAVAANQQLGVDLGVFSTPVFIINGQPVIGAQPTEVFVEAVDAALSVAG